MKRKFCTFQEARKFARSLGLKSVLEWRQYSKGEMPEKGKRPKDIHSTPDRIYKNKGWKGYGDWLGIDNNETLLKQALEIEETVEVVGITENETV